MIHQVQSNTYQFQPIQPNPSASGLRRREVETQPADTARFASLPQNVTDQNQAIRGSSTKQVSNSLNEGIKPVGRLPLPYQDIQQVAAQAGFIDVTPSNIERAYLTGQSLLVDYTV